MSKWFEIRKGADFKAIADKFGISPITARILRNRELKSDEEIEKYLKCDVSMLNDPRGMEDIEKGASIILEKIKEGECIRVIGDYDVDGICSSFILVTGLRLLGGKVDYVLPDRVKDGYGLSEKLVDDAFEAGIDTIITCDNGIAAYDQISHAKEKGMTVVVTDHHEVPFEQDTKKEILPPADAVVDPKRSEGSCSFREICGAVVAYKFLQVLSDIANENEKTKDFFDEMLVFAGIATVCDVMELRDENRIIVRESLKRIKNTKNRGLQALINVNGLDASSMSAYHYGFVIGPCLNASGRLDLASRALSLFLEEDERETARIAQDLKELNDSRKDMTQQGVVKACEIVDKEAEATGSLPKVLVVYLEEVHESIAGIVAGRIKEKYYRPTIVLTRAADGGAKGSARSIESYDMFEELSKCKELFTKFGGHKMAAGLSLPEENVSVLKERLNDNCALTPEELVPVVRFDMVLPFNMASLDVARELEILEPFGTGNNKPLFAQKDVRFIEGRILGKNRNCGKYRVSDGSGFFVLMFFGDLESFHNFLSENFGRDSVDSLYDGRGGDICIKICYSLSVNSYMGNEKAQLVMSDYSM
ncbi:MAG: single-stranded-DNA-specific exonuclease RecJ [Butyrivibrio sp.]|nr:single-stranded-DNA-specific exonuclease RecJ [Butyrivibrio sp.]